MYNFRIEYFDQLVSYQINKLQRMQKPCTFTLSQVNKKTLHNTFKHNLLIICSDPSFTMDEMK